MSLVGYPIRPQFSERNVRAINTERRKLEQATSPVDPRQPNGRQRRLYQQEIDLIIVIRTHGKYSLKEHSASAEPMFWSANKLQAQNIMKRRFRVINLNQDMWPDAEIISHPHKQQDLKGRRFCQCRIQYGYGEVAGSAAIRSQAPRDGWTEKINRLTDLAKNPRRVQKSLERYERDILAGRSGYNNNRRRKSSS